MLSTTTVGLKIEVQQAFSFEDWISPEFEIFDIGIDIMFEGPEILVEQRVVDEMLAELEQQMAPQDCPLPLLPQPVNNAEQMAEADIEMQHIIEVVDELIPVAQWVTVPPIVSAADADDDDGASNPMGEESDDMPPHPSTPDSGQVASDEWNIWCNSWEVMNGTAHSAPLQQHSQNNGDEQSGGILEGDHMVDAESELSDAAHTLAMLAGHKETDMRVHCEEQHERTDDEDGY